MCCISFSTRFDPVSARHSFWDIATATKVEVEVKLISGLAVRACRSFRISIEFPDFVSVYITVCDHCST